MKEGVTKTSRAHLEFDVQFEVAGLAFECSSSTRVRKMML
jgi:hypothetical protein